MENNNSGSFSHPGDVHAPAEFGFDMSLPEDRAKWGEITGEVVAIGDYTLEEAQTVQRLVAEGFDRDIAVQTVMYERLERG